MPRSALLRSLTSRISMCRVADLECGEAMWRRVKAILDVPIPRRIWLPAALVIALALSSVTHGFAYVDDNPLANADVLVARGDTTLRSMRTDSDGFFWFPHAPFSGASFRVLICAPRVGPIVMTPVAGISLHNEYRTHPSKGRLPGTLRAQGWRAVTPASCQKEFIPGQ